MTVEEEARQRYGTDGEHTHVIFLMYGDRVTFSTGLTPHSCQWAADVARNGNGCDVRLEVRDSDRNYLPEWMQMFKHREENTQ